MNYIYELPPTDWFEGFVKEEDLVMDSFIECGMAHSLARVKYLFAKYTSWEGDGQCYISSVPSYDSYPLIFITIKQNNNGSTFLMSPIQLDHLKKYFIVSK